MKKNTLQWALILSMASIFLSANLQARALDAETIQYINDCSSPDIRHERLKLPDNPIFADDLVYIENFHLIDESERPLVSVLDADENLEEEIIVNNYGVDMEVAYSTTHRAAHHYVLNITGDCLELEDHSIWQVRDKDKVSKWLPTDTIAIAVNTNIFTRWSYPYKFVNLDTKEIVKSKLKLPGVLDDPNIDIHIHWITNIDYACGFVRLEDGSLWKLPLNDYVKLRSFSTYQIVIVGTNDGWFRSSFPNILICVKNGAHVRGIVVN